MSSPSPSPKKQRMIRGELYHAFAPELIADRARAKAAMRRYNAAVGEVSRREEVRLWREVVGDTAPLPLELLDAAEDKAQFEDDPIVGVPVLVDYGTQIKLGKGVFINSYSTWIDTCPITVGDRTMFGPNVSLYSGKHPLEPEIRNGIKGPESGAPITIGEDCWIGGSAIILAGVTIGRGSTVGAGSVVTKNVPPFHVVAGNPARVIRKIKSTLDPEQNVERREHIAQWEDESQINAVVIDFSDMREFQQSDPSAHNPRTHYASMARDNADNSSKGPVTDYSSTVTHWLRNRLPNYKGSYNGEAERPSASYIVDMLPPAARPTNAADTIPIKHLHSSLNKIKHPINVVRWTPEGRRLLTASTSGEFTLWNGTGFNFETIMQAHDSAIRALEYSHSDDWLISGDHDGLIKYWQPNFNNVKSINAHSDPIRDLAFSPNDSKFVSASDDSTLKIFDFALGQMESKLEGHGWDAKSVDWHPTKGLLVSGSKDHLVKLWDPRTTRCLTTLHGHKSTITKVMFERVRGACLATSARDQTARVFDLRMMRDICLLKGHEKDISTLTFHPVHANLLTTGGMDGSLFHYLLDSPNPPAGQALTVAPYDSMAPSTTPAQSVWPMHRIPFAHDYAVWSLDWHPLGHILASGSNDRITRFWTRARPGDADVSQDRYHIGEAAAEAQGTWDRRGNRRQRQEEEQQEVEDEMDALVDQDAPKVPAPAALPGIPGLPLGGGSAPPGLTAGLPPPPPPIPGVGTNGLPPPPFPLPGLNGPPPPPLPGLDPNHPPDPTQLLELMKKAGVPLPPPGALPPGLIPPPGNFPFPVPPPPMPSEESETRRRAPLPSQEESLRQEQRQGKYTRAR
ncbi:protein PFS2 [Metarhizium album ARSEF 1941]|uniref:Polyadenylation factor subunit 2 n=1 Tax=Metarhizium album (strain ARSEF 1941) TaxID=1081103 RepID=A0A0B2X2Z0_METAS|nr:protein PFS2 [Metarhizium album ARSEF 1941]KHN99670.1 protein PFS2 [Metarhizium album ARSEF 1941]